MPKRRTEDRRFDEGDTSLGLTGAFAPVRGPQSVDYDSGDDPVGLTQAFGAVPAPEEDERGWSEADKWKGFDWDSAIQEEEGELADEADELDADEDEDFQVAAEEETQDEELQDEGEGDDDAAAAQAQKATKKKSSGPKHGRHAAPEPELTPRMQKSRRTRRVLIVLVILLVVVVGALLYFMFCTFNNSQQEAAQQAQEQVATPRESTSIESTDDAAGTTTRLADVPDLSQLLGMSQDEAIAAIGHGALVTSNREVNEEGNPIKANLNVALTDEVADSKTGTPTVYLGLGEDGKVRQAGYSASASALGFGSLSFADAVNSEHVVEKTLEKTGITIPEGSAVLPANKADYTTYGSDGTTITRERCSFEGDVDVKGIPCVWSAVLSYDYTTQVVTGNLTDTVRIIYVYITEK